MFDSTRPGATAFTRIPSCAQLVARFLVSCTTPALAAPYPGTMGTAKKEDMDARLTTLAPPGSALSASPALQARAMRKAPNRLMATAASKASGSHSLRPPGKFAPALLTSTSTRPTAAATSEMRSGSVMRSEWNSKPDRSAA